MVFEAKKIPEERDMLIAGLSDLLNRIQNNEFRGFILIGEHDLKINKGQNSVGGTFYYFWSNPWQIEHLLLLMIRHAINIINADIAKWNEIRAFIKCPECGWESGDLKITSFANGILCPKCNAFIGFNKIKESENLDKMP